jgi:hypothetical protein
MYKREMKKMLKLFFENLNLRAREEAILFRQPHHHVWPLPQTVVLDVGG